MNDEKQIDSFVEKWIEKQNLLQHGINVSIIVPAYNEERRLPPTLVDMIDYLDGRQLSYEIIVVDDGSSDQTSGVVQKFERIRSQVRSIRLPKNYGKGHAVRTGMLNARGAVVLFADADGATPIEELVRLEEALEAGKDIAIGSRAIRSEETEVKAKWYRKIIGRVFNFLVNSLLLPDFADTQCGFKLFSAPAARYVFHHQQSDGFSFDLEILLIARKAGLEIIEVPVNWHNVPGSKVNLIVDSMKMFCDIFVFRVRHRKISPEHFRDFLTEDSAAPQSVAG